MSAARRVLVPLLMAGALCAPASAFAQHQPGDDWGLGTTPGATPTPTATVRPTATATPRPVATATPVTGSAGGAVPYPTGGTIPSPSVLPTVTPAPAVPTPSPALPTVKGRFVPGKVARMRPNGKAAIPSGAPKRVQLVIAMANRIIGLPYKWGGGHALLDDVGYDCSGTVSFALIKAGVLAAPLVSGSFAKWGDDGAGRWATIYANADHVYMEIAGLRLDTSAAGDPSGLSGVRWRPLIGARPKFTVRHPDGF